MSHPDHIGKYLLEEYLGGGMSDVYRAKNPQLDKTVVVKILKAEASADEEWRGRFLREARIAASMDHPNIISVYEFGEDDGRPYIVMEFLKGEDLKKLIAGNRTGDYPDKLRLALQIASALSYIHNAEVHGHDIVHRDVKPENIQVTPTGAVKIIDFGIAKTENLAITREGVAIGTVYYMAPEQIEGKDVTKLADIYAYGILLYELFTGSRPFTGETVPQIVLRILKQPIDLQPLRQENVPESIINLIASCTAKKASERPQSFSEISETLESALAMNEATVKEIGFKTSSPKRVPRWAMAGLLLVLIAAVAIGVSLRWRPETPGPQPPDNILQTLSGEMVLIPGGKFLSGEDKKSIDLPPFYINRTEVTNEAYGAFCVKINKPLPTGFVDAPKDFPVVNITIDDARQFARWAGMRLPTFQEWEKAARGVDGREYPWGDNATPSFANVSGAKAAPVDAYPNGDSPWGVRQMTGNVWEFVDDLSTPTAEAVQHFSVIMESPAVKTEPWYVIVGGSYLEGLRSTYDSLYVPARYRDRSIGFRCVKDVQ